MHSNFQWLSLSKLVFKYLYKKQKITFHNVINHNYTHYKYTFSNKQHILTHNQRKKHTNTKKIHAITTKTSPYMKTIHNFIHLYYSSRAELVVLNVTTLVADVTSYYLFFETAAAEVEIALPFVKANRFTPLHYTIVTICFKIW